MAPKNAAIRIAGAFFGSGRRKDDYRPAACDGAESLGRSRRFAAPAEGHIRRMKSAMTDTNFSETGAAASI